MIFVAAPYSNDNKSVRNFRAFAVSRYCAKLLNEGKVCISPIAFGHTILEFNLELPYDFNFWGKLSLEYLKRASELHVLKLMDWEKSGGIKKEIEYAHQRKIPVRYIDVINSTEHVVQFEEDKNSTLPNLNYEEEAKKFVKRLLDSLELDENGYASLEKSLLNDKSYFELGQELEIGVNNGYSLEEQFKLVKLVLDVEKFK